MKGVCFLRLYSWVEELLSYSLPTTLVTCKVQKCLKYLYKRIGQHFKTIHQHSGPTFTSILHRYCILLGMTYYIHYRVIQQVLYHCQLSFSPLVPGNFFSRMFYKSSHGGALWDLFRKSKISC